MEVNVVSEGQLRGYKYETRERLILFLPWTSPRMWDITVLLKNDCNQQISCEIHSKKLSQKQMNAIAKFLSEGALKDLDEIKRFLKSVKRFSKCHVYRISYRTRGTATMTLTEYSKGAPNKPRLQYPGSRLDQIAD